jgi:hypothetical protein
MNISVVSVALSQDSKVIYVSFCLLMIFDFWSVCVWTLGTLSLVYISHLSLIQKHL